MYSYLSDNVIKKKIRKRRASIIVPVTLAPTKPVDDADLVTNPFGNPFKQRVDNSLKILIFKFFRVYVNTQQPHHSIKKPEQVFKLNKTA